MNIRGLARFLTCFSLLLATVFGAGDAFAQYDRPATSSDTEFVLELLRQIENPPQNKREAMDRVVEEFKTGNTQLMKNLAKGTSAALVGSLAKAMAETEDTQVIQQMLEQLEKNEDTYLRFLVAAHEQIAKDPARLERMQKAAMDVRGATILNRTGLPPFGDRTIQGSMLLLAVAQWIYGNYSALATLNPHEARIAEYFPYTAGAFMALAAFGDFRVFKLSWKQYFARRADRRNMNRNLRAIQKILRAMKASPELGVMAETYKFYASRSAQTAVPEYLAAITSSLMQERANLEQAPQAWTESQKFSTTKTYLDLVADLNSALTEHEKQLMNEKAQDKGLVLPFELHSKLLNYEAQLITAYGEWAEREQFKATYDGHVREITERRSESIDGDLESSGLRTSHNLMLMVTGVALGIVGMDAALMVDAGPMAQYPIWMGMKQMFADYHMQIGVGFTASIQFSAGLIAWEAFQLRRRIRDYVDTEPELLRHIDPLMKLFRRKPRMGPIEKVNCDEMLNPP